jgi:putative hemolysin
MHEQYPASFDLSPLAAQASGGDARPADSDETTDAAPRAGPALVLTEARNDDDVRAAQRLRYRVFVDEMGAKLDVSTDGIEADHIDPFCAHILVRQGRDGPVVGTYRLLPGDRAHKAGGFIAEELFDLGPLSEFRRESLELGRACVDPALRGGVILMMLWSGIARYAMARGSRYLFGCASIDRRDGGGNAARVHARAARDHLAPPAFRVTPRIQVPAPVASSMGEGRMSAVLKGYLRMGAWVCSEPAWDRRFDTADLFVLLPMARFVPRYALRFLNSRPRTE